MTREHLPNTNVTFINQKHARLTYFQLKKGTTNVQIDNSVTTFSQPFEQNFKIYGYPILTFFLEEVKILMTCFWFCLLINLICTYTSIICYKLRQLNIMVRYLEMFLRVFSASSLQYTIPVKYICTRNGAISHNKIE